MEILKQMIKLMDLDKDMSPEDKKELEMTLKLYDMAQSADDDKIEALGMSIDMLSKIEGFTPFELAATCSCLITGAVKAQRDISDKETAEAFYKHLLSTLERTIIKVLEEESDDCKDGDCSCKCE